jgi:hypothetical protein
MVVTSVIAIVGAIERAAIESQGRSPADELLLADLLGLIFFLPTLAGAVRRMHDTDHSGWWALVPLVNLYFSCLPGNSRANRFGPDPKAPAAPSASVEPASHSDDIQRESEESDQFGDFFVDGMHFRSILGAARYISETRSISATEARRKLEIGERIF